MKKTLLITLLLIPFLGIAQKTTKPIEGALGIKFGASASDAKAAIKAKGGLVDEQDSSPDRIVFGQIKLGDRTPDIRMLDLVNNKVYAIAFVFKPEVDGKTLETYFDLVNDVNSIYGKGKSSTSFKDPYNDKDDDGDKIVAIQNGDASYLTEWKADNKNMIQATIETNTATKLAYFDDVLYNEAQKAKTEKAKSDF